MKFLFLESFYGGSHQAFCDGLIKYSKHEIDLLSQPALNYKWRIRSSAYFFHETIKKIEDYNGIICTSMTDLSLFKSLHRKNLPPMLFYFHENQIDYPISKYQKFEYDLAFSNINSALTADLVLFNSNSHKNNFFKSSEKFFKRMPGEYSPQWIIDSIREKTDILYPGCEFLSPVMKKERICEEPVILWNHRWNFDKKPEFFLLLLKELDKKNIDFKLVILGEESEKKNFVFTEINDLFRDRILHFGYVDSKEEYFTWLHKSDIIISTAIQENFGYSVVEAVKSGCIPLLPKRLSYPEIIPPIFHEELLYNSFTDLLNKALKIINQRIYLDQKRFLKLFQAMEKFSWKNLIDLYDHTLEKLLEVS